MNEQAFGVLEYDGLRALVRRGAQTPMGRARVDELAPLADLEAVLSALGAVAECVELRRRSGGAWSFSELADPSESIARLRIEGAMLEPLPLLELARLCDQAGAARALIQAERADAPVLWELVADLPRELYSLAARVTAKILPSGELDDRASPELARIRHDINRLRSNITRSLETLMRRSDEAIQDQLVTVRNDRFVIPVRSDHRGRVGGVAHGFSSSGATVFIEPLETIESNNELQNLRETEEREIARILSTLTDDLRRELPSIERAAAAVAELDFINAKAVMAVRFNCVQPYVGAQAALALDAARHPLLEENLRAAGGEVVPVSFQLDSEHPLMVISGANAGGKTVVLKTAGLLALMALSGLHVPARAASFPFYRSVLADIGDSQSLAANLSTFTAHVANISRMLELCPNKNAPALVLLDEVGTGTDPEEGSALGVAVVDHFRRACGAHVVATTHYSGLKQYAANESGVLNASVEFDERTLQPTYRLLVGLAGSSSGIEIAGRFGFPRAIVEAANARVHESSREAAEYLRRIKRESEEAEALRRALEEERAAVADKYSTLDRDAERHERERQATFEREMRERLSEFEQRSKEFFSKIEDRAERARVEREAARHAAELRREAQRAAAPPTTAAGGRHALKSASAEGTREGGVRVVRQSDASGAGAPRAKSGGEVFQPASVEREIVKGDTVRLLTLGKTGVVDRIAGADAEIRIGHVRLREKLSNLELMERAPQSKQESARGAGGGGAGSQLERMAAASARTADVRLSRSKDEPAAELNLIGRTTDEAMDAADKFLDEAFLNGLSRVRIIHGHGTGALRRAIADFLRTHAHVETFAPAPPDQGGAGATVVELKQ